MILIITGPPAAGKSTIGPLIATAVDRCVLVDIDWLKESVTAGVPPPWRSVDGPEAMRQGVTNAVQAVVDFAALGFDIVILDMVSEETGRLYHQLLVEIDHQIVRLLPSLDVVLERNQTRDLKIPDVEVELLHHQQSSLTVCDLTLDNSNSSAETISRRLVEMFPWHVD